METLFHSTHVKSSLDLKVSCQSPGASQHADSQPLAEPSRPHAPMVVRMLWIPPCPLSSGGISLCLPHQLRRLNTRQSRAQWVSVKLWTVDQAKGPVPCLPSIKPGYCQPS